MKKIESSFKHTVFTLRALVGTTRGDVLVKLIPWVGKSKVLQVEYLRKFITAITNLVNGYVILE